MMRYICGASRPELAPDVDDDPGERRGANPDAAADAASADADAVVVDGDADTDRDGDIDPFGARTNRLPVRPRRAGRRGRFYDSETRRRLTPPGARSTPASAYRKLPCRRARVGLRRWGVDPIL